MNIKRISRLGFEIGVALLAAVSAQALPLLSEFYYDAPGRQVLRSRGMCWRGSMGRMVPSGRPSC